MHMLSTEIHLRKLQRALALAIFRLFHMDFHQSLRLPFPLHTNLRDPVRFRFIEHISLARFWEFNRRAKTLSIQP